MLYYIFHYLREQFGLAGAGVFQYITFRAAMAVIISLFITMVFGHRMINYLRKKQIGETVRDLGLEGEKTKKGTPTMGGIIIISGILIPTLLFAKIHNVYIIMMLLSTIWLGLVGFLDDYIKVFRKNKEGLSGRFKILGQVGLGLIIGLTMYYNPNVTTTREVIQGNPTLYNAAEEVVSAPFTRIDEKGNVHQYVEVKAPVTTVPFVKNHELSYAKIASWFGDGAVPWLTPLLYIFVAIFIIAAVSNGANLTDGLDGLATGVSAIVGMAFAVFAYVSGNYIFAEYLNIMHIPHLGELSIFIGAFVGACVGFLWYNASPAQVFMGDTGSLALGGIIASLALIVRKELLLPIICGVFLIEALSVILQTAYFKMMIRKHGRDYAETNRVFKMTPIHHHYQEQKGKAKEIKTLFPVRHTYAEQKIVTRFWIISILLVVLSIVTLKIQ